MTQPQTSASSLPDALKFVEQRVGRLHAFDPATAGSFPVKNLIQMLTPSVLAVSMFSEYAASGREPGDFPFNEEGIPFVEQYVANRVRPRIARWDKKNELVITHVLTDAGVSSSARDVWDVRSTLLGAALVLGQCIAQCTNAKWKHSSGSEFMLTSRALGSIRVVPKVLKYCRFGAEDGLQGYARTIHHALDHTSRVERSKPALNAAGFCPDKDVIRVTTDHAGKAVGIQIRREDGTLVQVPLAD